jgi:hypothetical protein
MNELNSLTMRRIAAIKKAITPKGMTAYEVGDAIYLNHKSASTYLVHLAETDRVHVCGWRHSSTVPTAIYRWGTGENAPRPSPKTQAEGQHAYRDRIRQDPIANAFFLAKKRAHGRAQRYEKVPQHVFSALFVGVRASVNGEG